MYFKRCKLQVIDLTGDGGGGCADESTTSIAATQTDATQTEEEAPVACSVCYERVESVRVCMCFALPHFGH